MNKNIIIVYYYRGIDNMSRGNEDKAVKKCRYGGYDRP